MNTGTVKPPKKKEISEPTERETVLQQSILHIQEQPPELRAQIQQEREEKLTESNQLGKDHTETQRSPFDWTLGPAIERDT